MPWKLSTVVWKTVSVGILILRVHCMRLIRLFSVQVNERDGEKVGDERTSSLETDYTSQE